MLSRFPSVVRLALMALAAALAWQAQAWRYGRLLADQQATQVQQRLALAEALQAQLQAEREQRKGLELRLQASESKHFKELADAQNAQARLRDRLATADLRLSVLVERDTCSAQLPAAASTGSVDHGPVHARLDPAHAERIIAITDQGDRGLIALQACQDYVRALTR